ncbi:hypothetical protein [Jiangella sp. DSM 45060]|uniref:hypothetical protein n=1 Tax=Jiangella sp. DSM 45060 TaxID=1798224 RepID=UPI000B86A0D9|nr:hypothetical protein [Jiangella sp. DSM 45060]
MIGPRDHLGARANVVAPTAAHPTRQHVFLARLLTMDPALRCGPELTDGHTHERVPLDRVDEIDLRPAELVPLIRVRCQPS